MFCNAGNSQRRSEANKELNLPSFHIAIQTARLVAGGCLLLLLLLFLQSCATAHLKWHPRLCLLLFWNLLLWAIKHEVLRDSWLGWFNSISACKAGRRAKKRQMYKVSSWLYWSSLGVYQRRYTQRHTATLIFKGGWARMRGNKKIIMPIYIHYYIRSQGYPDMQSSFYFSQDEPCFMLPHCHLVVELETDL